jgi:hypothetical protein
MDFLAGEPTNDSGAVQFMVKTKTRQIYTKTPPREPSPTLDTTWIPDNEPFEKEPLKESVKEPVEEPTKESTREPVKESTKESKEVKEEVNLKDLSDPEMDEDALLALLNAQPPPFNIRLVDNVVHQPPFSLVLGHDSGLPFTRTPRRVKHHRIVPIDEWLEYPKSQQGSRQTTPEPAKSTKPPSKAVTPSPKSVTPPAKSTTPPAQSRTPPAKPTTPPSKSTTPPAQLNHTASPTSEKQTTETNSQKAKSWADLLKHAQPPAPPIKEEPISVAQQNHLCTYCLTFRETNRRKHY